MDLRTKPKSKNHNVSRRKYFHDFGVDKNFLHRTQNVLIIKEKNDKSNFIPITNPYLAKDAIKKVNMQPADFNKIIEIDR